MDLIRRFSVQHQEILILCLHLKEFTFEDIEKNADIVFRIQEDLKEILGVHLRLEDLALYPSLEENPNPKIASISKRLHEEVADCRQAHEAYQNKYIDIQSIKKDSATYIQETRFLVSIIENRIKKEESELFSLLT